MEGLKPEFHREVLGIWGQEAERKLRLLVIEYYERTEAYDREVCTGPIIRGSIYPANYLERSKINQHARDLNAWLLEQANALGFSSKDWREAKNRYRKCH